MLVTSLGWSVLGKTVPSVLGWGFPNKDLLASKWHISLLYSKWFEPGGNM